LRILTGPSVTATFVLPLVDIWEKDFFACVGLGNGKYVESKGADLALSGFLNHTAI